MIRVAVFLSCLASATAAEFPLEKPAARLRSAAVTEASGVAVSPTDPDFLWIINDSGSGAEIHLAGSDGSDRGVLRLKRARNIDWEDLAAFRMDGKPWLLVADCGDNDAKHDTRTLYLVREPALPASGKMLSRTVAPARQIRYRYEGGPRDCEAVAVDAKAGKILLLSKRTQPPELYELPLREQAGVLTARKVGTTRVQARGLAVIPFGDQPTGMDVSADGSFAAVVTYRGVFIFPRQPGEAWQAAFARPPQQLAPHRLAQAEGVAISPDGRSIRVVTEGKSSPIAEFRRSSE